MNRVVVTGMGVIAPNASDINSFKLALEQGVSGISHHKHLEEAGLACQVAGIPEFDDTLLQSHLHPNTYKYLSSIPIKYAVTAALQAWLDAGLPIDAERGQPRHEQFITY